MFPEIHISDSIILPTYLVYLSILYCFLIFFTAKRADWLGENRTIALDIGFVLMVGGFLGGRLLHIFYEAPQYYLDDWIRVLQFWEGGFVFFGGFLLALLGGFLYTKIKKISFFHWADFYAPIIALGYGLGRISCFLAGCCFGRTCDLPWAIRLAWDPSQAMRHPTQLYAVIWELILYFVLIRIEKKKIFAAQAGLLFFFWITFHGVGRLMMESFRDDFRGELIAGWTLSSWVALGIVISGIIGLLIRARKIS